MASSFLPVQGELFAATPRPPEGKDGTSTVFTGNMRLPVHRWFRYSAGFSAAWAAETIGQLRTSDRPCRVLDPFAGSGTTLIASEVAGVPSVGLEPHPLVARIGQAKLSWSSSVDDFEKRAREVLRNARPRTWTDPPPLLSKIYSDGTLASLLGLRDAVNEGWRDSDADRLAWLALVSILRACSPVGTAPWQYVLPNKPKARVAEPISAYESQIAVMAGDMRMMPDQLAPATLLREDARRPDAVEDDSVDLVITSPPYPNNYDYADATRIESTFLGEIEKWSDLQSSVRTHLMRSCSQHMARYDPDEALSAPEIGAIHGDILRIYEELAAEKVQHGGRKAYDLMIVAYFHDLARAWRSLRRVCRPGATAIFIVGDSAPYGIHVPVERLLGELALDAGFHSWSFEKIRDRNLKWKNRKHRVPLQEGILRVEG